MDGWLYRGGYVFDPKLERSVDGGRTWQELTMTDPDTLRRFVERVANTDLFYIEDLDSLDRWLALQAEARRILGDDR